MPTATSRPRLDSCPSRTRGATAVPEATRTRTPCGAMPAARPRILQEPSLTSSDSSPCQLHSGPSRSPQRRAAEPGLGKTTSPPAQLWAPRRLHTQQGLGLPAPGRGKLVSVGRQQQQRPAGPACTGLEEAQPRRQGPGSLSGNLGVLSTLGERTVLLGAPGASLVRRQVHSTPL